MKPPFSTAYANFFHIVHKPAPPRIVFCKLRKIRLGVKHMMPEEQPAGGSDLRIEPERRLCPKFDAKSIARFPVAARDEMGVRVVDNCAEEHIM